MTDKNVEQKTQEDELTQIKSKNADLNAQLGKLKRVLCVMERHLKLQKGKLLGIRMESKKYGILNLLQCTSLLGLIDGCLFTLL